MSEREFIRETDRIARGSRLLEDAIEQIQALFVMEIGETQHARAPAQLLAFSGEGGTRVPRIATIPVRGVYTTPFGGSGALIVCVGSWGGPNEGIQRLVDRAGVRLSSRFNPPARIHWNVEAA